MGAYAAGSEAYKSGILSIRPAMNAALVKIQWALAQGEITLEKIVGTMNHYPSLIQDGGEAARPVGTSQSRVHKEDGLPQVYSATTEAQNNFQSRHTAALAAMDIYRRYKGRTFRWLGMMPEAFAEKAAPFLPRAANIICLSQPQREEMHQLTDWTPRLARNEGPL